MLRVAALLALLACPGCGARTALAPVDGADAGAARLDAGPTPARSCWAEPSCIEMDFTRSALAYREVGVVTPTGSAFYLDGASVGEVSMSVKLMRDATPGIEPYDPDDGNVFVYGQAGEESCTLLADIELTVVDVRPGGVTEGAFAGELAGRCDALGRIREGRFRLTAP